MKAYNLAVTIVELASGLKSDDARERLALGIILLDNMDVEGNHFIFNKIAMPLYTKTVFNRHRFDIPVGRYVGYVYDIIGDTFDLHNGCMVLRKNQRALTYSPGDDQEAKFLNFLEVDFRQFIDIVEPEEAKI